MGYIGQPDVCQEISGRNSFNPRFSSIVCSALPNGSYSTNSTSPSGVSNFVKQLSQGSGIAVSGFYKFLDRHYQFPTYYSA